VDDVIQNCPIDVRRPLYKVRRITLSCMYLDVCFVGVYSFSHLEHLRFVYFVFTCLPEHSALWRFHHVPWLWSPFAAWHKARSGRTLETQWAAQWRTHQGKQPFYQLKLFLICPEITPLHQNIQCSSLTKQPTFCEVTNGFPVKCRLKKKRRNSILIKCHYPDLGASDWLK